MTHYTNTGEAGISGGGVNPRLNQNPSPLPSTRTCAVKAHSRKMKPRFNADTHFELRLNLECEAEVEAALIAEFGGYRDAGMEAR